MEEIIYHDGYFTNKTKQYLGLINNKYNFFVDGEHRYIKTTYQNSYSDSGEYLGQFKNEERYTKKEIKIVNRGLNLFQLNYKFELLPLGDCDDVNGMMEAYNILYDSKLIKNKWTGFNGHNESLTKYLCIFLEKKASNEYDEDFDSFEMCHLGYSRFIKNTSFLNTINLDISEYTKMKDLFILQNPKWKEEAETLYKINIGYLMNFWRIPKKALLKNKFCRRTASVNKLHRKITKKRKEL